MSVLSDEKYKQITESAGWNWDYMSDRERDMMRAVANAAIAADRAARAEAVAYMVSVDEHDDAYVVASLDDAQWIDDATNHGAVVEPLYAAPPAAPVVPECHWSQDDDVHMPETWGGVCGAKWSFIDGGPVENEMHYCPNCGGRVMLAAPAPSQDNGGAA